MKNKWISILLFTVAMLSLVMPVSADVIWEPENSFYEKHRDECVYEDRTYELAGYDGSVTIWNAPAGTVLGEQPNGSRGRVQFRWSGNGVEWAYIYGLDGSADAGWAPMDDLALVYDSRQFEEDHAEDIVTGDPIPVTFSSAVLYSYPGGPMGSTLKEDAAYMPFSDVFSSTYTDGNGQRWGYVGYYMGRRNGWVCLDDPLNEHLDTDIVAVKPSKAQLRGVPTATPGAAQWLPLALAGVLVVLVVAITLLGVRKVQPRKRA